MNRFIVHTLCLLACCATVSAQGAAPAAQARDSQGFIAGSVTAPAAATNAASPATPYAMEDKHKLYVGDRVSFLIQEDRTNATTLFVTSSTELDIPYIGRMSVADKTCAQVAAEAKAALEKDYYYTATVVVGLDAVGTTIGKVYVYGPVRKPGPVEIPSNEEFTASKAVMQAGGFGDFADSKHVKIIRKTPTGNTNIVVNLRDVLERGKTELDIKVQPDDFIIVPESVLGRF